MFGQFRAHYSLDYPDAFKQGLKKYVWIIQNSEYLNYQKKNEEKVIFWNKFNISKSFVQDVDFSKRLTGDETLEWI